MQRSSGETDHCKRGGLSSGGGIKESEREGTSLTRAWTMRDCVYGDGNDTNASNLSDGGCGLLAMLVV
jgi:hypothetical protein